MQFDLGVKAYIRGQWAEAHRLLNQVDLMVCEAVVRFVSESCLYAAPDVVHEKVQQCVQEVLVQNGQADAALQRKIQKQKKAEKDGGKGTAEDGKGGRKKHPLVRHSLHARLSTNGHVIVSHGNHTTTTSATTSAPTATGDGVVKVTSSASIDQMLSLDVTPSRRASSTSMSLTLTAAQREILGDGPSQTLLAYIEARHCEAPADWQGFRPLTSK